MMTDYYRVLRKAIDELENADADARRAVYGRASKMVVSQLRGSDPPMPQAFISMHVEALKTAVLRIEGEFAGEAPAAPPRPAPARPVHPATAEREPPGREIGALPTDGRRIAAIAAAVLAAVFIAGLSAYFLLAPNAPPPASQAGSPSPARPTAEVSPPASKRAGGAPDAAYILRPQRVFYRTTQPVGSVIVSRGQRFLYVVQPNNVAIRYAIGLGAACGNLAGMFRVTEKIDATGKPAGAFDPPALYFGGATHAVHKTSEPTSIGQFVKAGCLHTAEQDMADLYQRIPLDERIIVSN